MHRRLQAIVAVIVAVTGGAAARAEAYGSFVPSRPQLVVQGPLPPDDAVFGWSPDSRLLATVSPAKGVLQLWDAPTGNLLTALPVDGLPPDSFSFTAGLTITHDKTSADLQIEDNSGLHCLTFRIDLVGNAGTRRGRRPDLSCPYQPDPLTPAPDGTRPVRRPGALVLTTPGRPPVALAAQPARTSVDLAATPDAASVVLLTNHRGAVFDTPIASTAEVWSLASGRRQSAIRLPGNYHEVRWLTPARFAMIGSDEMGTDSGRRTPPPTVVVDAATGHVVDRVAFRCLTTPLGATGAMVAGRAVRPDPCRSVEVPMPGDTPGGLWVRPARGAWRRVPGLDRIPAELIATNADGSRTAVSTPRTIHHDDSVKIDGGTVTDQTRVFVVDGDLLGPGPKAREVKIDWLSDNERISAIRFTADGTRLVVATDARILVVPLAGGGRTVVVPYPDKQIRADDGHVLITTMWDRPDTRDADVVPLDGGAAQPYVREQDKVFAAGFVAGGHLAWAATADGSLSFYGLPYWNLVLVMQNLGEAGYVAYDPDSGRYDSPLGPDANAFRWRFPDEPLRSLGGQTFLRDYFEPQLFAKTLACTAANSCFDAFPPLPSVAGLDRTLPAVRIAAVRPGPTRDTAIVDVAAASVDAPAANGRTHSGLYDLRLFRDGKLVGQWPAPASGSGAEALADWQRHAAVPVGPGGGTRHSFTVRLPTGLSARHAVFTAYAFNDDRVKSDTARATYDRPWLWPARRKAYILTIGINDYAQDRFDLGFAVADADLLAKRLDAVPGYAVRRIDLRGTAQRRQATAQAIANAIALLAPGDHAAARASLRKLGVDPSPFAAATPDDLVVITFAGHGWADPKGNFYLVPSDENWPDGQDAPDLGHLVSAAQLTDWLRPVDFGDAAIVIDACNSAAVVATADFKPGPLGDRGLGQLAYDKGILILAASQTDQKAHEDARLGHGFLTAALARDGLDGGGFGQADLNGDGVITLDEWLRYAVGRLPTLSAEVAGAARGRDFLPTDDALAPAAATAATPQQPSLFDFAGGPSPVILGTEPWRARLARFGTTVQGWGGAVSAWLSMVRHLVTDTLYGVLAAIAALLALGVFLLVRWVWRVARRRLAAN